MSSTQDDGEWSEYIARSSGFDGLSFAANSALGQAFSERRKDCFSDEIRLRILDFSREPDVGVEAAIRQPVRPRVRVISIHSQRTIEPLQITPSLMLAILSFYNVPFEFVPILLSFGDEPHLAEGSSSYTNIQRSEQSMKISYQIRFIEQNHRKGPNPWSLRHTGIYHHHSEEFDLYILLQPNRKSTFEQRLLALTNDDRWSRSEISRICADPFRLHSMLFTSYDNWRWYFRFIADKERFSEKNDIALTQHIDVSGKPSLSFEHVQNLRNLQDVLLRSRACCDGNLGVVTRLLTTPGTQNLKELQFQDSQLREHMKSADVLQARIRNAIDWIGYSLNMRNEIEASEANRQLRDLTQQLRDFGKDAVDDSSTVKIITFVSTVYLTGSFVASIFGMNFFDYDSGPESNQRRIRVTDDLWLFFAIWIPTMIITWCIYRIFVLLHNRSKNKHRKRYIRQASELSGATTVDDQREKEF